MIRNFLFDLYGTLVDIRTDEQSEQFWQSAALIFGTDAASLCARYRALCAAPLPEGAEIDLLEVFSALCKEFSCPLPPAEAAKAFRAASRKKLRLYDGALPLLRGLKARGAGVYLLSNAQACFTRGELSALGLDGAFDGIALSSEIGWKKPSERFFRGAFAQFGLDPAQCVYVGNDLRDDVGGARAVGMRCVYIETEQSGRYPDLLRAETEVSSHAELARCLFALAEGR